MVLLLLCQLTQVVLEKRPLNECSNFSVRDTPAEMLEIVVGMPCYCRFYFLGSNFSTGRNNKILLHLCNMSMF